MAINETSPYCADDGLAATARDMVELRDFLIGLIRWNGVPIDFDTLTAMKEAEDAVAKLLVPGWDRYQVAMAKATAEELAECDTTWMGQPFPYQFRNATVETLKGYGGRAGGLRTGSNPATLIAMGAV